MTPPRSLGRCAPAVNCGGRYLLANDEMKIRRSNKEGLKKDAAMPFFHRLRPPDEHHKM